MYVVSPQYSSQQNALHHISDILYYNILLFNPYVLIPHGIIVRDSYQSVISQTELALCICTKKV
jgi:hypothetical protein